MDFDFTNDTITPNITPVFILAGTGAVQLPSGSTANQPAGVVAGAMRWNTTVPQLEYYNGSAWTSVTGSSGVSTIAGTANQITASASTGAVTLSVPSTFVAPGYIKDTTGHYLSTTNTISAAGTTQGTATALTTSNNIVTTVAANSGVVLPVPSTSGLFVSVVNNGINTLNVYPSTGVTIDSGAVNLPATIPPNGEAIYAASSTTAWNTIRPAVIAGNGITLTNGIGTQTFTGGNTGTILQQVNGPVSTSASTTATYTPALVTSVLISAVGTIAGVVISGTGGTFTCTAFVPGFYVGQPITISGVLGGTGSITGYANPTTYYVIATTANTNFTLSATQGGAAITTTTGTPSGLTYSASPGITVGTQVWTQSFTPTSVTSKTWIQFALTMSASATNIGGYCLVYANSTCINITCTPLGAGTNPGTVTVYNYYQPASLTPITFSARVAGSAAGTLYINETSISAVAGAMISRYTITEVT